MYAQGLTLLVLVASAGLEVADARSGMGNYETVKVLDPADPTHSHLIEKRIHHESYAGEDLWKGKQWSALFFFAACSCGGVYVRVLTDRGRYGRE